MEEDESDKLTSLLRHIINYDRKKFNSIGAAMPLHFHFLLDLKV